MMSRCDRCGGQGEYGRDIKLYGTSAATTIDRTVRICRYCIWRMEVAAKSERDTRSQNENNPTIASVDIERARQGHEPLDGEQGHEGGENYGMD